MSSVIIAGNTSGTITLDAPNVAGTTVLTLPTANGTVLTTANTFSAGTGPAFKAYNNATQSISSAVATKVTFQVEEFDTNNNFASSTFTPTVAGYYQITGNIRLNAGGTRTYAQGAIYKNGSMYGKMNTLGSNNALWVTTSSVVYCNGTTDYIEIYGQTDGTAPSVDFGGNYETYFCGAMIRSA
jgi:hypothetical protein